MICFCLNWVICLPEIVHVLIFFACGGGGGECSSERSPHQLVRLWSYYIKGDKKKSEMLVLLFKQICIHIFIYNIILWMWQYFYFRRTDSLLHSFLLFLTVILSEPLNMQRSKLLLVSHPSYVPFFHFFVILFRVIKVAQRRIMNSWIKSF